MRGILDGGVALQLKAFPDDASSVDPFQSGFRHRFKIEFVLANLIDEHYLRGGDDSIAFA